MATDNEGGRIIVEDEWLDQDPFIKMPVVVARNRALSVGAKIVYMALVNYHWQRRSYPGHRSLAEEWGIGERSVKRYFAELEAAGLLASKRPGLGQPNIYTLRSLKGQIGPSRGPEWPNKRAKSALASQEQDSVQEPSETDFDIALIAQETATALGRSQEGKQFTTWARKQGIPRDILEAAGKVTVERMTGGEKIEKPVAYLQTVAKVLLSDRQQAAEVGKRKGAERRQAALAYARQIYADKIIGGDWRQVQSILAESYGPKLAAEVVQKLQE